MIYQNLRNTNLYKIPQANKENKIFLKNCIFCRINYIKKQLYFFQVFFYLYNITIFLLSVLKMDYYGILLNSCLQVT